MALFVLFAISLSLFFADIFEGEWDRILFGNLAMTLAGVLFTFILLESYIRHRDRKLADHRRRIALRSLSLALRRHLGTLFNMFKATSTEAPNNPRRQVEPKSFFDETFYNTIIYLDFAAKAPVVPSMHWGQYLSLEFEDFTKRLESAVDKFGAGLFPSDLDLVEQLVNSPYAGMLIVRCSTSLPSGTSAMMLSVEDGGSITFTSTKVKEDFYRSMRAYHEALIELIGLLNESRRATDQEPIMVVQHWEQQQAPAVGSARISIVRPN
jgi:hypothetical protein